MKQHCSNCTLLELKHKYRGIMNPLLQFKLHLTGIETYSLPLVGGHGGGQIAPYWN